MTTAPKSRVEILMRELRAIGFPITPLEAGRVLATLDEEAPPISRGVRAGTDTGGSLAVSPASVDAPSTPVRLARVRDANVVAAEVANGVRSA